MLLVLVGGVMSVQAAGTRLYFKTDNWSDASAVLVFNQFNGTNWDNSQTLQLFRDGIYYADANEGCTKFNILRKNPNDLSVQWNYSGDITFEGARYYIMGDVYNGKIFSGSEYLPSSLYFMSGEGDSWNVVEEITKTEGHYTYSISGTTYAGKRIAWAFGDSFKSNGALDSWEKVFKSKTTMNNDDWTLFSYSFSGNVNLGNEGSVWFVPASNNENYNDGTITITYNPENNNATVSSKKVISINGAKSGDYYYATFSCKYNVAIPSGVKAYYASTIGDDKVTMAAFSDGIRSTEGAFLRLPDASGTYTFTPAVSTDNPSTNVLVPGTTSGLVAGDYVFAKQNNAVGFYKITNALVTDMTGKAYIAAALAPAPALNIEFEDGETTGIYRIEANEFQQNSSNGQMYDLQGRRVAEPSKGIYIMNGKKVIIK